MHPGAQPPDDDIPVLRRVLRPGRPLEAAVAQPPLAVASGAAAPERVFPPPPPPAPLIDPAALEERVRLAVLDELQTRLPDVIRECLDRNLEPLLHQATASLQLEIRDSLHGLIADTIARAMRHPPRPDEPV